MTDQPATVTYSPDRHRSAPGFTIAQARESPLLPFDELQGHMAGWLLSFGSQNTRDAYRRDLREWCEWLTGHGVELLVARRGHVDAWAREMESGGLRPTTVARRLAAVSSFYSYIVGEGVVESSPVTAVRRPRTGEGHVKLTQALDRDEVSRLLEAAHDAQDRALMIVLAVQGLRVSEALSLDFDGIETVRGHRTVVVHGKGGREDRAPLPPLVVDALEALTAAEGRSTGPVFVGRQGQRMSRHTVTGILARLAKVAGLDKDVRPHMLRATAITGALDAGATLRDVQDFARHADPRTTRRYDRDRGALDRHASYAVAGWLTGG